ncbi:Hydroxamate-type ferrichrome siderophore peptide synthetase [Lachnellula occidentalis]|uniref:Hydroxamate-type ferrichrome siderophore peptide synthetase n=1 Tax=Lachnellula occidentalis TaxID=215460 RepID=A0A8H8UJH8_9HELO|nr:Hydroxamate-type ferrichrome siderophore peptide synthetase [Lachnellula occidentalis]
MAEELSIINDPPELLEGPQILHQLIRWESHGDSCAIDFTSRGQRRQYSYAEIRCCVDTLVLQIQQSLDPDTIGEPARQHIIPVLVPQSPGLYISQLAVLSSGGGFCPINLDAPQERIKFVVGDVSADLIITTSEFKEAVSWENGPKVILVDEFPVPPEAEAVRRQSHLAYVMYTSGSSGTPKGVAVSHLAVSQSLLAHERHIPPFKRFLQFAAPSFDVSVFEIYFPLIRGSTLVGCNRSQLLNDLPGMVNELKVDACELTPTVAGALLQKRSNVPGLKLLLTIGEMLTRPIVEEFGGSDSKNSMLYGMYGPTEAAIHCTIHPRMKASAKPGNIGLPFDTVSTFIATAINSEDKESEFKVLPVGELGELVLGGPQLANGYLNREEQNKMAFVHVEGKILYRTGDKARQLEDGTIEILGRMSAGQVKLRGQRVELGEIEEVVYKHPGVKTVTAMVISGSLVVFALVGDDSLDSDAVLETCAKWLPRFMVPSEVVLLQEFSYLPSGKVDKRKLEADYQKRREFEEDSSADSVTPIERIVKETLRELLGPFPTSTRLTVAGLDSLMAIRVASKLRTAGFNLTTVAVLQAETFKALVQLCEESEPVSSETVNIGTEPARENLAIILNGHAKDVESTISCTPLQSAMLSETAIDERAYINWVELELTGITDLDQVNSALLTLSERNAILRTGFTELLDSQGFAQIIWQSLQSSQVEHVKEFRYALSKSQNASLHHPLWIQIMQAGPNTRLLMHIHHALYDAWSLELLLDDLNTILLQDTLPSRPPFANIVNAYLDGTLKTNDWTSKDYWKDHLADVELRQIPNFHTKKSLSTGLAVSRLPTSIATTDAECIARQLGSSPQSLFQAAYATVLSSYLGSSDICFGTVFSGRTLPVPGIEDIAGPCLATLPIRIDIAGSNSFKELVQELNASNRKHLEHSTLPLRGIKAACGVKSRQPLFDTLLIWQQTLHSFDHSRKHVTLVDTVDNLEFNLTIEIIPGAGNLDLKANYQQSLFPESQINILLRQIEQIVLLFIQDENISLEDISRRLGDDVLSIENPHPETGLGPETLASPVERLAAEDPHRPAINFARSIGTEKSDIQHISYSQLNSRANQMVHHLLQQNVLPDELVCICMEKSVDLYASILATTKAGAGYLPLTPDIPYERLKHILGEANVKVVMAHSSSQPLLTALKGVKVVYVDKVDFSIFPSQNIPSRSSPENLSYCVFTSGSTGTPKGVLVTQGNLVSNLDVLEDLYPTPTNSRLLQSCSQAFDVSVFEIFFTWRIGGCICSATKDVIFRDIEDFIRVLEVTHLSLTPTVAALIDPKNVPKVQFLVTAGEAVTQKVFNVWAEQGLYQGYGPSETTNICTVNPKVTREDFINNIGPPFKNTSAFVLSPQAEFSLVPRGGEGEFCFGGAQVFHGYMDKTQEVGKIIDHPKYGRLYRSGDFGRLMPDGSLAFTGRKDDQVKIRGQRVELGEINNVMLRSEEVRDCMTMVINGENDSSAMLICFWTSSSEEVNILDCLHPDPSITSSLFRSLESALPAYMIPSALIPVSYLPSTSQGKIDKRLLVQQYEALGVEYLDLASQASRSASNHEWTDIEVEIAKSLAQITKLPLEHISPDSSFFNLGIDSISAISFARLLRQNTHRLVEISDVLKFSSVARLAERLSSREDTDGTAASPVEDIGFGIDEEFLDATTKSFEQAGRRVQSILPCTPLQEAMLSAADSSSDNLYSNQVTLTINGNIERIQSCWSQLVQRHEILRTCFVSTDMPKYAYAQVVLAEYELKFGYVDIAEREPSQAASAIPKHSETSEFQPPYSLDLVRSSGPTGLLISMHHALYDGVALGILYEELEVLYHGQTLPAAVSFAPFLKHMISMDFDKADTFWGSVLKGYSPTRSKFNIASREQPTARLQRLAATAPLAWIEDSIKKHSTSLLAVCQAAWSTVLSERFQETDVCFGNVVSGRTLPVEGIERLVAPCFNTIPTRLPDIHKLSHLEAFRKLQAFNADSLQFHLTPLRRLQSKYSLDGSRLFDTLFILQQPSRDLDSSIWSITEDNGAMDFPLVCEVVPKNSDDTLEIILHSYSSTISTEDALALLHSFGDKIQDSLKNPRRQLLASAVKDEIISRSLSKADAKTDSDGSTASSEMTTEEITIRNVISDFTDVPAEKIGRHVSIFRLGLDSISTVQVATRLRKQGHSVMASDILEHPTISQLVAYLSQRSNTPSDTTAFDFDAFDQKHRDYICTKNKISSDQIEAIRPCTAAQKGMIAQSLHSDGQEYVNSMWMELLPSISLPKLKAAWERVCQEHEMLRTSFASTEDFDNPFVMVTTSKYQISLPWYENKGEDSAPEQSLRQPWSLALSEENGEKILRFKAHHALYDAQSIQMILSDVTRAYISDTVISRPSVNALLGAIISSSEHEAEAKKLFWQKEENKVIVNHFPDLTPLRVSTSTSGVREIKSQASISEFEESCRQNGVTMQAAGQATWARLLTAYIGEPSTTFGMTLSGRSIHEEADKISFPSIITLPVRCDVTGTNAELLSRTMTSNAQLHKHQFTPLTSIQKWAGFREGKIFDTLFAYQKLPDPEDDAESLWKIIREEAFVDYAVSMEVQPAKSGDVTLRLTFREDIIPAEHSEIILKQYDALLLDTLRNPHNICNIAPNLETALLSITPAKENELPDPVTLLHEFVERGARKWPNKKALEFATRLEPGNVESQSWTYDELNKEGNQIAHLLIQQQVAPGQIIAICFDKCAEASFAIIGILKAGCAYVALDPNAPADRLKFIVQDSGAKLVLTAGKPGKTIQESLDLNVILLDSKEHYGKYPCDAPELSREISPQDVSYCLYTSGTTGTPKGCLLTHENAVQAMLSFQRLFADHWTEDSKWLQFASFHFDVSVLEQFWSWSVGICVASAPRDLIFEDISGAIQLLGITHIDLTPSLARLLHPKDVPSLCKGVFITGGEQLREEIIDVWGEYACIYNGYGPTEATIGVTMYPRVPANGKPSNIGPQFDNVGSFVLKPGTALPVLRGGIGELCVSGKLVGKGYLNRADLTTERFPTLDVFNERIYRTGDLVRILADGSFIFVGRADDQVKLRGQRLELSEINEVIKKSVKELQDVVTLVLKHSTQQKEQLVTFFVANSKSEGDAISEMRNACKARLPGYMVPTHFIPIESLPLNANNKADSKQLAAMYNELTVDMLQKLSQPDQPDSKWNKNENSAVETIAQALQIESSALTRGTNLFELGLDSISIIGFSRALQNSGFENAKLSVVKSNPSIGGLVAALISDKHIDQGRENAYVEAAQHIAAFSQKNMVGVCQELGVESTDVECIAPCTPMQEGMIYRFLESDLALYFNKFGFRLDDGIDTEELLSAWKRVVARLQVLRMKFVATDDGYAQVVMKQLGGVGWQDPLLDFETLDKSEALKNPYTLGLKSTPSGTLLQFQMFHALYNGNSFTMLLQRLVEEYQGQEELEYGPPFQSSLAYGPLANIPGARKFWEEHLEGWSDEPMQITSEASEDVVASSVVSNIGGLENLRKSLGVTLQAVIQAAWLSVLQIFTSPNLTIGVVTSGRSIDFDGADKVIGPLFNTVPFHTKIQPGTTFAALILECHDYCMQMQDFQHTPLKDIQKWSPARPGQALFESLFVFQRSEPNDGEFADGLWTQVDDEQVADYPLAFEATLDSNSENLNLTIVAQGSVVAKTDANSLLDQMEGALHDILSNNGKNPVLQGTRPTTTNGTSHISGGSSETRSSSANAIPDLRPFDFEWTLQTEKIRTEIAALAKFPESAVLETSSIFELGLDSIDVIKLSSRLKKQGIDIPVSVIIKGQSIAKMAVNISANHDEQYKNSAGELLQDISQSLTTYLKAGNKLPSDVESVLPATPLQQSMVNEMIRSNFARYFNIEALKLNQDVDPDQLVMAVNNVLRQSPIFRTTFVEIEDPRSRVSYAQIIHKLQPNAADIPTSILTEGQDFETFMEDFKIQSAMLAKTEDALCQFRLVEAGQSRYLVMAISHALYDGTSLRAFHEDIYQAYQGKLFPRPDFLLFLEQVVQSTTEDAKKFWRSTLSNLPAATFPRKEQAEALEPNVHRLEKRSRVPLQDIEAICKSSRITLQTLGQTCWTLVLSRLMGQLDVIFGSVLSCRDSEEANEVMFPLMNTVAVRSVLHGSLGDMLTYMQELSDSTRQYQHFPLGTAQAYALASRQDHARSKETTLFDTLFIYQGRRTSAAGQQLYEPVYGVSDVEFPVCVEMEIVDDEYLTWTTACKSSARTAGETDEIVEMLDAVLSRIVSTPQAPAIVSDADGISVCGLPRFKKTDSPKPQSQATLVTNGVSDIWSDLELNIRKALHEISDVSEDMIHKDSTIFHLGLDSILVLKLPALLREHGIKLSVSDILREQTVSAMAQCVLRSKPESQQTLDVDVVLSNAMPKLDISHKLKEVESDVGEVENVIPVTSGQLYMIRQWQASRGALFFPTFSFSVAGRFDRANLDSAWTALLQRHAILRTGFLEVDSDVVQIIYTKPKNEVSYTKAPPVRSDLRSPPASLEVEESNTSQTTIKLTIHHALYDGISLPILVEELQALYEGHKLESSPGDFKAFVARSISSSSSSASKGNWISYLKGTIPPQTKTPNGTLPVARNKRTEIFHPSMQISSVKTLAQETGVSIDALFLAGISKQYAQHSSSSSVVFGIYLANRAPFGDDLSSLAAPTLNLLPLRVNSTMQRGIPELAKDIQRDLSQISSKDMSSASLAQIYEWTGVRVDFVVNILKSAVSSSSGDEAVFQPLREFGEKAEVVHVHVHVHVDDTPSLEIIEGGDAYLVSLAMRPGYLVLLENRANGLKPTIDVEVRYEGEKIDMGVFAPNDMISIDEAEGVIRGFRELWV